MGESLEFDLESLELESVLKEMRRLVVAMCRQASTKPRTRRAPFIRLHVAQAVVTFSGW